MSFGIQIFNEAGVRTFDSTTYGGLFLESFDVTAGTGTVVKTYPSQAGYTMMFGVLSPETSIGSDSTTTNITAAYGSVDYSLGYPRLTITRGARACTIVVFIK